MYGWFWLGYRDATREQTRYGTRWLYHQAGQAMPGGLMGWRCASASLVEVVAEG